MNTGAVTSLLSRILSCGLVLVFIVHSTTHVAWAKPSANPNTSLPTISTEPNELPIFTREKPRDPQECDRFFLYQGRKILCDSVLGKDAEPLRPILAQVPESIPDLEKYQQRRKNLKTAAYFGSIGLGLIVVGLFSSRFSNSVNTQKAIRKVGYLGGLGFITATGIFGVVTLSTNEANLGNAVKIYNQHRPDDPIQLQFSTGILF